MLERGIAYNYKPVEFCLLPQFGGMWSSAFFNHTGLNLAFKFLYKAGGSWLIRILTPSVKKS